MSNIGIPMWVFQLKPRNSEARKPTSIIWFRSVKMPKLRLTTEFTLAQFLDSARCKKTRSNVYKYLDAQLEILVYACLLT